MKNSIVLSTHGFCKNTLKDNRFWDQFYTKKSGCSMKHWEQIQCLDQVSVGWEISARYGICELQIHRENYWPIWSQPKNSYWFSILKLKKGIMILILFTMLMKWPKLEDFSVKTRLQKTNQVHWAIK